MYALIVTATGWTWEYVRDQVTLPRLNSLREYWMEHPPTHIRVSTIYAILGGKVGKPTSRAADVQDGEEGYVPPEITPGDTASFVEHATARDEYGNRMANFRTMKRVFIDNTNKARA